MASDILTVDELQQYLKIPRPTIYTLAQQGRIPAAKIGRHWRFQRSTINQWLREQQRMRIRHVATLARSAKPSRSAGVTNGHQ